MNHAGTAAAAHARPRPLDAHDRPAFPECRQRAGVRLRSRLRGRRRRAPPGHLRRCDAPGSHAAPRRRRVARAGEAAQEPQARHRDARAAAGRSGREPPGRAGVRFPPESLSCRAGSAGRRRQTAASGAGDRSAAPLRAAAPPVRRGEYRRRARLWRRTDPAATRQPRRHRERVAALPARRGGAFRSPTAPRCPTGAGCSLRWPRPATTRSPTGPAWPVPWA